jgi:zinc transport system ATP-binding protein
MNKENIIKIKDISYNIGTKRILHDINIFANKGDIVTFIGPNGSGKTTLLRIMLGIIKPTTGKIYIKPGTKIGYMPQKIKIDDNLPLTVEYFLNLNIEKKVSKNQIEQLSEEFKINKILKHPIQNISGGEMQRVLLMKTILAEPDLLVLDEPVQAVDVSGQIEFYDLIEKLKKRNNMTIIMVSHDLYMVMKATDRVYCLNQHICCEGTANDVSNDKTYKQLFGERAIKHIGVYSHEHDHTHNI